MADLGAQPNDKKPRVLSDGGFTPSRLTGRPWGRRPQIT
jgi:hypothetical protein